MTGFEWLILVSIFALVYMTAGVVAYLVLSPLFFFGVVALSIDDQPRCLASFMLTWPGVTARVITAMLIQSRRTTARRMP